MSYTHDIVIKAFEEYQDAAGRCESLEDLEELSELSEYGGTDLEPQVEALIRAFACIDSTRYTGRG